LKNTGHHKTGVELGEVEKKPKGHNERVRSAAASRDRSAEEE
jgi:hypothetical protein